MVTCNSCKKPITNSQGMSKFNCPRCGEYTIIRCKKCREIVTKYTCAQCGFEGPN